MVEMTGSDIASSENRQVTAKFRITGRVQGVGYRWWLCEQARARGLGGFVRNESDGSVTALLVGARQQDAEQWLSVGPPSARVSEVAKLPAEQRDMRWPAGNGLSVLGV